MGRMGPDIFYLGTSAAQVERALDHIFNRGDGRDVGPVAARGAQQIDHVLGGIDLGKGYVAVLVGVGMTRQVAAFGVAHVGDHIGNGNTARGFKLGTEDGGEWRTDRSGFEYRVLAAIGAALGGAGGFRVGQILHQQFGAGALRGHAGSSHGKGREQAHYLPPSWMAVRTAVICDFINWDATWKRSAFSASRRASRSRLTLLPSFFTGSSFTSMARGAPPAALRNSD